MKVVDEVKVGDVMVREVKTLPIDANVVTAAKFMREYDIGSILITKEGRLKGILTETDIVRKVVAQGIDPSRVEVGDVMSTPLITIGPDASLKEAAEMMRDRHIKKLPVVNEHRRLLGIITQSDIVKNYPSIIDLIEGTVEAGLEQ